MLKGHQPVLLFTSVTEARCLIIFILSLHIFKCLSCLLLIQITWLFHLLVAASKLFQIVGCSLVLLMYSMLCPCVLTPAMFHPSPVFDYFPACLAPLDLCVGLDWLPAADCKPPHYQVKPSFITLVLLHESAFRSKKCPHQWCWLWDLCFVFHHLLHWEQRADLENEYQYSAIRCGK